MFTNILVALDGSDLAEQALPVAETMARQFKATIHLVQAVSRHTEVELSGGGYLSPGALEMEMDMAKKLVEARLTRGDKYLESIAAQLRTAGLKVKTTIVEGAADEQIVHYAKNNDVDLITMTRHGHGGLRRLLMGSVIDRVIRRGDTPVLVLPAS